MNSWRLGTLMDHRCDMWITMKIFIVFPLCALMISRLPVSTLLRIPNLKSFVHYYNFLLIPSTNNVSSFVTFVTVFLLDVFLFNNEVKNMFFFLIINPIRTKYLYTPTYNTRWAKGYQMTIIIIIIIIHAQKWYVYLYQLQTTMVYWSESSNMIRKHFHILTHKFHCSQFARRILYIVVLKKKIKWQKKADI